MQVKYLPVVEMAMDKYYKDIRTFVLETEGLSVTDFTVKKTTHDQQLKPGHNEDPDGIYYPDDYETVTRVEDVRVLTLNGSLVSFFLGSRQYFYLILSEGKISAVSENSLEMDKLEEYEHMVIC